MSRKLPSLVCMRTAEGLRLVVEQDWFAPLGPACNDRRGKRHNRGLGPYPLVSLDAARDKAVDIRRAARDGRDLAVERRTLDQDRRQR